jgi:uncharacterized protein
MKGKFIAPFCNSCNKKIWPPSYFCSSCLEKTELKKFQTTGTLIEFTTSYFKNRGTFGVIDLDGIRVIGSILGEMLYEGMRVTMTDCGVTHDGSVYYQFEPASDTRISNEWLD